ncbi:MAG TPA: riboflavin synthase [Acidimicrobiia bacterium]|nr:riboflavin synthase [Acidimicrobiia bacterium]
MFTGIVERVGEILSVTETETGRRLVVSSAGMDAPNLGASISVNGVCLTALDPENGRFSLDVVPETLSRTNLGELEAGETVNLERAMSAKGRFDGHVVQGHVDGTGSIEEVVRDTDGSVTMTIVSGQEILRYVVEKGSITVDGVSLTVAGFTDHSFSVALIPHTLEVTTLGLRKSGDVVNLEVDILAKYIERLIGREAEH